MKTTSLFMLHIMLMTCASPNGEIEIPIQIYDKNINTLGPNETLHKDKDVEILRIPILGYDKSMNTIVSNWALHKKDYDQEVKISINDSENENRIFYSCIIYRIDKGILKGYQAHISSLNNFDNAKYQWVNDSTVTIYLNNKFHISKKYTIMGYESTTLLHWDD